MNKNLYFALMGIGLLGMIYVWAGPQFSMLIDWSVAYTMIGCGIVAIFLNIIVGFKEDSAEGKTNLFSAICMVTGTVVVVAGGIFKVMHWPYAGILLLGGLGLMLIGVVTSFVFAKQTVLTDVLDDQIEELDD